MATDTDTNKRRKGPSGGSGGGFNPLGGGNGTTGGVTGVPTSTSSKQSAFRDMGDDSVEFLKEALAQAGDPSKWGGTTPAGFDCSGLVQYALHWAGISAPRTSEEQAKWAVPVTGGTKLQPGDLIFEKGQGSAPPGHVIIYLGNDLVIAADEGGPVRIRAFNPATEGVMGYGRPPGLSWNPGATGAQTYMKEIDRIALQVARVGPITVPLAGIKLPTIGASPKHNTGVYIDRYGDRAIRSPTPSEVLSAYERVQNALRMWGLDDKQLVQMAYSRAVAGEDYYQIINDIRKTPQYARQFPGMSFREKEGLPLISETQYISYERAMMGLVSKYALPHGFIDKHEVGELIAHNVSPSEFNDRLKGLSILVTQANPLVKKEFEHYFGVKGGNGALAAYWANPEKATMVLNQQLQAAEYGAQVKETGLGALNRGQAISLSHFEYLHTPGTVANAIADVAHYRNLEGAAPGSTGSSVGVQQLLGSRLVGYDGSNAKNAARVRNAEAAKEGQLIQGGGYTANPTGVTGAGSASTEGIGRA